MEVKRQRTTLWTCDDDAIGLKNEILDSESSDDNILDGVP